MTYSTSVDITAVQMEKLLPKAAWPGMAWHAMFNRCELKPSPNGNPW